MRASRPFAEFPFEGSDLIKTTAKLRFRISDGSLSIGYFLVRPREVLVEAFGSVVREIEQGTGLEAYAGTPPELLA